jgi:hypothetical protein
MVHVTQQTLKLLGNDYDWEPNCGNKSPLLDKLNIKTFLIKPRKQVTPFYFFYKHSLLE